MEEQMDYYKIGQRIRKHRKAQGLSQEQLAEKIDISVTHMSHIETGNTKLSLSVFADIVKALGVKADELLFDKLPEKQISSDEIAGVFDSCTDSQLRIIADVIKAMKISFDKYM